MSTHGNKLEHRVLKKKCRRRLKRQHGAKHRSLEFILKALGSHRKLLSRGGMWPDLCFRRTTLWMDERGGLLRQKAG